MTDVPSSAPQSPPPARPTPADPAAASSEVSATPLTDSGPSATPVTTSSPSAVGVVPATPQTHQPELATAPHASPAWEPLSPIERRILGVLIEKQKTGGSPYPMSLNSLVIGCNQKSAREPVMELTEEEVEAALQELQQKGLVEQIVGGRVARFRHKLYERWTADAAEMAVLAELLLRGPQPRGLLRARASRMDPIPTLGELEAILDRLARHGLVVFLTAPHRRGAMVTHGFHTPEELAALRQQAAEEAARAEHEEPKTAAHPPADQPQRHRLQDVLLAVRQELEQLRERIAALEQAVAELQTQRTLQTP